MNTSEQINEKWVDPRPTPKVYAAIAKVMAEIGRTGIAKGRKNTQQGYQFRGIDDVYNALSGILSGAGLVMLPRVKSREVIERQTKSGATLFYVTLDVEFDLVCAEDGSVHTIAVAGEAMDSADKATNKAMSAAYKYGCMQVFCIPTEGDNDADATTHQDVAPKPEAPEINPDAWVSLGDAAKLGEEPLKAAWRALKQETRTVISTHYSAKWEAMKATAKGIDAQKAKAA